jgi:hypothetical protein
LRDDVFQAAAAVLYGTALFAADFSVSTRGMVEMVSDRPLVALDGNEGSPIDCPIVLPKAADPASRDSS